MGRLVSKRFSPRRRQKCLPLRSQPSALVSLGSRTRSKLAALRTYYAIVDVDSIFNLAGWREINVRDPKDSGYVPNQIRQSLLEQESFFLINRGLAISAESVHHDNKTDTLQIVVSDKDVHGLMDGGRSVTSSLRNSSK